MPGLLGLRRSLFSGCMLCTFALTAGVYVPADQLWAQHGASTAASNSAAAAPKWVQQSNEHAGILLNVLTRFNPEMAWFLGVEGVDERLQLLQVSKEPA